MKKFILTTILMFFLLPEISCNKGSLLHASQNVSQNFEGKGKARTQTQIQLEELRPLFFGTIMLRNIKNRNTFSISEDDTPTSTYNNITNGRAHSGIIKVSGSANTTVNLSIKGTRLERGSKRLRISYKIYSFSRKPTVKLDENGTGYIAIGGTLIIPRRAEPGEYVGTYTINASY